MINNSLQTLLYKYVLGTHIMKIDILNFMLKFNLPKLFIHVYNELTAFSFFFSLFLHHEDNMHLFYFFFLSFYFVFIFIVVQVQLSPFPPTSPPAPPIPTSHPRSYPPLASSIFYVFFLLQR